MDLERGSEFDAEFEADLAEGIRPDLPPSGLWRDAFRELRRKRSAVVGMVMLAVLFFVAIFAPLLAPYDPGEVLFAEGVSPRDKPCVHIFGCDEELPAAHPRHRRQRA